MRGTVRAHDRSATDAGFTIIELAVVVLIIAILATIAIATYVGQRDKAQRSSAISSVRNTLTLAEAIRFDASTYPSDPAVYTAEGGAGFTFTDGASEGPTEVSIHTLDDGETLVLAAQGGDHCFFARTSVGSDDTERKRVPMDELTSCDAENVGESTGPAW